MDADVMRRRMAQAGYWLCVGGGGSYESEAVSLFSAMATQPTDLRKAQINALIVSLKANGVWNKLGVFYVFAAHAAQAALLNWKAPSGTAALATNSPTFTTDRGYAGDGVSAFIDTQTAWSAVPGVAQNNAHLATAGKWGADGRMGGVSGSFQTTISRATTFTSQLNDASANTTGAIALNTYYHAVTSRQSSAGYDKYLNGSSVAAVTATSAAPSATNLVGLRTNTAYAPANVTISALHAGAALTATEAAAVHSALLTYMAAVGAS